MPRCASWWILLPLRLPTALRAGPPFVLIPRGFCHHPGDARRPACARVTLSKIIDPAQGADQFTTPDSGKRFVGIVFAITAVSGSPQDEDANADAAVVGSNGQTYTADFDPIAGYTNFSDGSINVAQGDTATGAVTFQVPDGVKVTEVQWTPAGGFGSTVQWEAKP